jgi:exodeoxyribonuclease V alpha subunit
MTPSLHVLMETGRLPPLAYYFARFVARGCGLGEDSVPAVSAALVSARNLAGDVCVVLPEHAGRALFAGESDVEVGGPIAPSLDDWLEALRSCPWVGGPGDTAPLILDGERLYLAQYWRFETEVAGALLGRMAPAADLDAARLADGLERLFPAATGSGEKGPRQPDCQRIAAAIAVTRRFAVISGGPGTGKTTTVVKVLALLLEQAPDLRIALAAPTGKAAARLAESIGVGKQRIARAGGTAEAVLARIPEQAQTIHRLLGYDADGLFRRDDDNPLPADCLVVDEASMIDLPLMARLLAALPAGARLVLLGDRDQLASVEAGSVLGDITGRGQPIRWGAEQVRLLAAVGAAPATVLAQEPVVGDDPPRPAAAVALLRFSWRFGSDSGIGALSRAINAGDGAAAVDLLDGDRHPDVTGLAPGANALNTACIDWAVERFAPVLQAEDPESALERLERARVLAALRRGPFGVETLNARIAYRLHARGQMALPAGGDGLHHGMPVMVTANDYEVGLYNGDVGVLWSETGPADGIAGPLRAHFRAADGSLRVLSIRQLPPHVCAYALTVHKSQGSEFDEVMLVLPPDPIPLVSRELLYTAVTRARQRVVVHAGRAAVLHACATRVQRTSALAERLGWPF